MHRRLKAELLLLDTEFKKTLRNLKKVRIVAKITVMAKQEDTNQNVPAAIAKRPQR